MIRDHFRYLTTPEAFGGIDFLRAVAVASVVLFHFWMFPIGWIGVDLFFVISGFLIGGMIIRDTQAERFSFGRFYGRRALRILPVYYAAMLFSGLVKDGDQSLSSLVATLALVQTTANYFFGLPMSFAAPGGSWSLVIEEHFYLIAPVVIVAAHYAAGPRGVLTVAALVAASGPLVRMIMTSGFAPDDPNWHFASVVQFHSHFDQLAAGVLVAGLVRGSPLPLLWRRMLAIVSALLLVLFVFTIVRGGYLSLPQSLTRETIWLPSALAAMFAIWVFLFRDARVRSPVIIALARLSYPLYLFHLVIYVTRDRYPEWPIFSFAHQTLGFYGDKIVLIGYSIVFAYLISLVVEFPFLRLYKPRLGAPRSIPTGGDLDAPALSALQAHRATEPVVRSI